MPVMKTGLIFINSVYGIFSYIMYYVCYIKIWLHESGALAAAPDGFIYKLLTFLY